jgi:hypothetical protein
MAPILSDCEPIEQQIEDRGVGRSVACHVVRNAPGGVGAIGLRGDGGTRRFF